jgi:hypothetical protein
METMLTYYSYGVLAVHQTLHTLDMRHGVIALDEVQSKNPIYHIEKLYIEKAQDASFIIIHTHCFVLDTAYMNALLQNLEVDITRKYFSMGYN